MPELRSSEAADEITYGRPDTRTAGPAHERPDADRMASRCDMRHRPRVCPESRTASISAAHRER